jgi:hypothetical protein
MQPTRNVEPSPHEPAVGEVLGGRWRISSCVQEGRAWLAADTRMHDRNVLLVRAAGPVSASACAAIEAGSGAVAIDFVSPAGRTLVVLTTAGSLSPAPPSPTLSREERAAAILRAANDLRWLINAAEPIFPIRTPALLVASGSPDATSRIVMLPDLCEQAGDRDLAISATRSWFAGCAALWLWGSQDDAVLPPRWAESWDAWEQGVRLKTLDPAASLGAMLGVGSGRRVPVATAATPDSATTLAPSYAHTVLATRRAGIREQALLVAMLVLLVGFILLIWSGAR